MTVIDDMNGLKKAKVTKITPLGSMKYCFELTTDDGRVYQSDHRMHKVEYEVGQTVFITVVNDYVSSIHDSEVSTRPPIRRIDE